MAKMKLPNSSILFRVGAHKDGTVSRSHLYRCISLAGELRRLGQDVGFFIRDDKIAKKMIKKQGFSVFTVDEKRAAYETALLLQSYSDVIVFDGIDVENRVPAALANSQKRLVVIDDSGNKRLEVDAVINGSFVGNRYRYAAAQRRQTRYFLGPKYCVLSPEYDDFPVRPSDEKVKNVVISFGSMDPKGFSVKVARVLKQLDLPFELIYVIGPGFRYAEELGRELNEHRSNFYFVENPDSLSPLLATADLVLTSAGRVCYEASRVGTPMIILPTVNHQELVSDSFGQAHAAFPLPFSWTLPFNEFATQLKELLELVTSNKNLRDQARVNAYRLFDGKGRERVAQIILSCLNQQVRTTANRSQIRQTA